MRSVSGPRFAAIAKTGALRHSSISARARAYSTRCRRERLPCRRSSARVPNESVCSTTRLRMIEEQRLDANLENIDKGIEALDVRQFVAMTIQVVLPRGR